MLATNPLGRSGALVTLALLAGGLTGCRAAPEHYERTTVVTPIEPRREGRGQIGGGPAELGAAIAQIAEARCDRELKCGSIGPKKALPSRSACIASVESSLADGLNAESCPAGINARHLSECLAVARDEECGNPFDTIGRITACRTADLCRRGR